MSTAVVLVVAAVAGAALVWMYRQDLRRASARRRSAFEQCRGLLDDAVLTQDGQDYPTLAGYRDGVQVELRLLADTIQLRKLPVLWLLVTLRRPVRVEGAFDMMLRPDNSEYYSAHDRLRQVVPTPRDWPEEAVLRTDTPGMTSALIARLDSHVRAFAANGRGKELFLSPKGIRLVYRIDESQRGHYLVTRQPLFEHDRLERATAAMLIDRAFAIARDLEEPA